MREDMQKVVVERPRRGSRYGFERRTPRQLGEEYEGYVRHEGMRRAHRDRKELSDNLNPLWRYLDKQVGRPWNAVWSEICERLDFRSVLGYHVKTHIDQHVERNVRMIDGQPHGLKPYGSGWAPVFGLYVHPRTGLLRRGHRRNAWRGADGRPWRRAANPYESLRRIVGEATQLHVHQGQWYEVTLAEASTTVRITEMVHGRAFTRTAFREQIGDVLGTPSDQLEARYGRPGVIATAKRQLSRKEKRRHALRG